MTGPCGITTKPPMARNIEEPVVDGPLPYDDPPNDDPDRARVSLDYATIVAGKSSIGAAPHPGRSVREAALMLTFLMLLSSCRSQNPQQREGMNIQRAEQTLRDHIERAIEFVSVSDEPVVRDSGPLPCDHPPNDDPEMAKVDLSYVTIVEEPTSRGAAKTIERRLREDGWELLRNRGVPETQVLFTASKDGYTITVSGSSKVPRLVVGGATPCVAGE